MAERVTLEEIISGKRCTPLTAQEFQLWLKHVVRVASHNQSIVLLHAYAQAYSLENLQFH